MTDLRQTLATSGADHQITREESLAIAQAAGGSEAKLSRALEAQGFRSWDADKLASKILDQATASADSAPTAMVFPTPPPAQPDQPVSFAKSRQARLDLVRSAPQTEPSDRSFMPAMSGGAALAAALILDSQSPKAAKANARAIELLARELGENPDLNKDDLAKLAAGKMTPKNLQKLQLLLFAMASRIPDRPQPGSSDKQLNTLVAKLREHGGLQTSKAITFAAHAVPADGKTSYRSPQWTVTVDDLQVNTWANDGHNRSAVVGPAQ